MPKKLTSKEKTLLFKWLGVARSEAINAVNHTRANWLTELELASLVPTEHTPLTGSINAFQNNIKMELDKRMMHLIASIEDS